MEPGNPEQIIPKEGWQNETETRKDSIVSFLRAYFESQSEDKDKKKEYDNISDLHFSGSNWKVLGKIKKGSATINTIEVLYNDGKVKQIHIVFDNENTGHNIDVYLENKALEDYLNN